MSSVFIALEAPYNQHCCDDAKDQQGYLELTHKAEDLRVIVSEEVAKPHHQRHRYQRGTRINQKESRKRQAHGSTHQKGRSSNVEEVSGNKDSKDGPAIEILANQLEPTSG